MLLRARSPLSARTPDCGTLRTNCADVNHALARLPIEKFAPEDLAKRRVRKAVESSDARAMPCHCKKALQQSEGSGAPEGAIQPKAASADAAARFCEKRARLSAHHRGSCRHDRTLRLSPGRASREREGAGVTTPSVALKRGTSRAGPIAGGDDARTARERKLRALPAGTARAPFLSAQDLCNSIGDKLQGRVTQGETKYFRGGQYRQNVGWAKARSAVPTRRLLHVKVRVGFATLGPTLQPLTAS